MVQITISDIVSLQEYVRTTTCSCCALTVSLQPWQVRRIPRSYMGHCQVGILRRSQKYRSNALFVVSLALCWVV